MTQNPKDSHHESHKYNNPKDFKDSKDTSATRILLIIREICNGKDINTLTLNDFDFNVSKRTFQRDIKKVKDFFIEHFAYIPIAVDSASRTLEGGGNTPYKKYDLAKSHLDSKDSSESATNLKADSKDSNKSIADLNKSTTNQSVDSIDSPIDSIDSHDSPNLNANQSIDSIDSLESSTNLKADSNKSHDSNNPKQPHNPNNSNLDSSLRATHYTQNDDRVVDSKDLLDSHKLSESNDSNESNHNLPKYPTNPNQITHSPKPHINHHNLTISFQSQKSIASYIKKFAILSGIKSLYPTLDEDFLSELLDDNINSIYNITQSNFEKINADLFNQISDSILNNEILSFDYKEKQRIVKPYKLSHIKGIWYLIADENNKLKHFSFTKMQNIVFLPKRFYPKRAFLKQINDNQNLWLSSNPKSALIIIDIQAKGYFLRKSLPKHISLIGYDDKKVLIRFAYAFDDEIFNFLKIWIPYARIKEPKALQIRFNEILEKYVREVKGKLQIQGESNGESKMDSSEVKGESKGESSDSKPNQIDSAHESKDS